MLAAGSWDGWWDGYKGAGRDPQDVKFGEVWYIPQICWILVVYHGLVLYHG